MPTFITPAIYNTFTQAQKDAVDRRSLQFQRGLFLEDCEDILNFEERMQAVEETNEDQDDALAEVPVPATTVVPISSAQLLDIANTPVELIPAPGAGKAVVVDNIEMLLTYNSAAYVGGLMVVMYEDSTGLDNITQLNSAILAATADARAYLTAHGSSPTSPNFLFENTAVMLSGLALPIDGDSDLQIKLTYRIIDVLT